MNDLDLVLRSYKGHVNNCVTFDVEYLETIDDPTFQKKS